MDKIQFFLICIYLFISSYKTKYVLFKNKQAAFI